MKVFPVLFLTAILLSFSSTSGLFAQQTTDQAAQFERAGQISAAREALNRNVQRNPRDAAALTRYAEFLDRYGDPEARATYRKVTGLTKSVAIMRRLVVLDLIAGDRSAATADLAAYHDAGGTDWKDATLSATLREQEPKQYISIPGPIRSFSRMAAISPDSDLADVMTGLARNVVTNGYQASHSNEALEPTEFLKLVNRYLSQARELEKLAGVDKILKIETCDSTETADLLRTLGFRMRGSCGNELVLETVNAARAFLSTDSGFPIAELEQALRNNKPFRYDYHPAQVPILFTADYWVSNKDKSADFLDQFLGDPSLCRFYLGMSKLDGETAEALRKGVAANRLRLYAHVLDFYGGMFEIRQGKAIVPGGQRSAAAWADLAGVSPDKGAAFFERLIAKDDGWLASQFDALARIHGPVQDYLTEPNRMKRFYTAVRGRITSPGPARPVFRSNTDMMLLTTRLRLDDNGQPHIPGSLEIWKDLFVNHPRGKYDAKLSKAANSWKEPDDVVEALFALSRKAVENEPLKIFMALSDLDRNRAHPLAAATVDRLARSWRTYGAQYATFNDAPSLADATILSFLDTAESIDHVKDTLLRQDAAGVMQALTGLWQIFCRHSLIPGTAADQTLLDLLKLFPNIASQQELFGSGRKGVSLLLTATGAPNGGNPQEALLGLLAGAKTPPDSDVRDRLVTEMQHVLDAQRIISLDVLFALADNLEGLSKGTKLNPALVARLAARVSEIQVSRVPLSGAEKNSMAYGFWSERHIENERKLNIRALVDKAQGNPEKLQNLQGSLAPLLRDTLVAYNYVHYAPPGAQILYTNPLFVRGHDFTGMQGAIHTWKATELQGSGWPTNAGGRLVGSLANLPYALAEAEQNFLVPTQTQALIWGDLVPQIILSAKISRWWNVTPLQLHWVGSEMRLGESLLAEAALDPKLRQSVMTALNLQAAPIRRVSVEQLVAAGEVHEAIEKLTPSELFGMASEMFSRNSATLGVAGAELESIRKLGGLSVSDEAISNAFGTPKPTLANSYRPELLKLRTFPTLMGYSSRIMAESWESNSLYWAALADQLHIAPSQLNVLVPEWTQKVVEQIFASHLEDWPALLKSLRNVGNSVRSQTLPGGEQRTTASLN